MLKPTESETNSSCCHALGAQVDNESCASAGGACVSSHDDPLAWCGAMVRHCKEHAQIARNAGRPIVGIMREYAPCELIMAAGAVPVCLCEAILTQFHLLKRICLQAFVR